MQAVNSLFTYAQPSCCIQPSPVHVEVRFLTLVLLFSSHLHAISVLLLKPGSNCMRVKHCAEGVGASIFPLHSSTVRFQMFGCDLTGTGRMQIQMNKLSWISFLQGNFPRDILFGTQKPSFGMIGESVHLDRRVYSLPVHCSVCTGVSNCYELCGLFEKRKSSVLRDVYCR